MKPNSEVRTDRWRRGSWAKLSFSLDPNIGIDLERIYVVKKVSMINVRRYRLGWILSIQFVDFDNGTNENWFRASCFDNVTPI